MYSVCGVGLSGLTLLSPQYPAGDGECSTYDPLVYWYDAYQKYDPPEGHVYGDWTQRTGPDGKFAKKRHSLWKVDAAGKRLHQVDSLYQPIPADHVSPPAGATSTKKTPSKKAASGETVLGSEDSSSDDDDYGEEHNSSDEGSQGDDEEEDSEEEPPKKRQKGSK